MTIRYAVFRPVVVIGCAPDHVDLAPFEELATDVYDRFMGCLYQPEDVVWYDDCPSLLERFARVTMVADHEERCYRTPKFKDFPGVIPSDLKGWYIW